MKENLTTVLTIVGTVLFFGLVNPELIISDDTVSVEDTQDNENMKLSDLPGDTMIKIEQLLNKISAGDDTIVYKLRILQLFDKKQIK